ncbi:Bax inhibitor-1/YccA family protein [Planosporangium mesophilum]|uniref:Bax inhibitor-1/YccA family protein n=1 Tax=Planosporangium mesophilum TaxID=689768 RepID=A0A8J3X169_9ACTN|nr:Bax inhibitor-1/YccA family protein [Planosporangium mesophilum]NJC84853.1 Bax inhibitor-1/YccA family protein [Planosporangium mesophilum]GII24125.1 hypothetical protein Pme01_37220 [Planosporangium mesophilum]
MESSNPVLTRLGEAASRERVSGYATDRFMSLDDVVVRTVGLVLLTAASAAVSWNLFTGPTAMLAAFGSMLAGLVLGLVISFARITNPFVIGAYAVVEGVLLGMVSRAFEIRYGGIVVQAVVGTLGVFAGMAVLYKMRVLRATPKFTRFVIGAMIGVVVLSLVNWIVAMFGGNLGLIEYGVDGKVGWLPIVFSLVCIGVGALTFILDFDQIEQSVRYGLPVKYSWYCAFGLLVGLIFLYWQILRLLGYLRR